MRAPCLVLALVATVPSATADAQEVLFALPPGADALVEHDRADLDAELRVGAQLEADRAERMPFSPGVSLLYRPRGLRRGTDPVVTYSQLGFALQAPTHGSEVEAAQRSLDLGAAVLVEPAAGIAYRVLGPLRLEASILARLEWQLARPDREQSDETHRIAPLLVVGGAQLGLALGPWVNAVEISVGQHLWDGGADGDYLHVVEHVPRLRLESTLRLWAHVQVFLHLLPLEGFFSPLTTWTAGLAGNLGVPGA